MSIASDNVSKYKDILGDVIQQHCDILHVICNDNRHNVGVKETVMELSRFSKILDYSNTLFPTYKEKNAHHWTTQYVWNTVIPEILLKFKLNVDLNKFQKISNIVDDEDYSYHEINSSFDMTVITNNTNFNGDGRSVLRALTGKCPDHDVEYPYHRLFRGAHRTSIIHNHNPIIDKKIFILNDSMGIPIIPILSYIFRSVFVRDYRLDKGYTDMIKEFNPDYYMCLYTEYDYSQELRLKNGFL